MSIANVDRPTPPPPQAQRRGRLLANEAGFSVPVVRCLCARALIPAGQLLSLGRCGASAALDLPAPDLAPGTVFQRQRVLFLSQNPRLSKEASLPRQLPPTARTASMPSLAMLIAVLCRVTVSSAVRAARIRMAPFQMKEVLTFLFDQKRYDTNNHVTTRRTLTLSNIHAVRRGHRRCGHCDQGRGRVGR